MSSVLLVALFHLSPNIVMFILVMSPLLHV